MTDFERWPQNSRIVPEYSFLDARGLGAYENQKLSVLNEVSHSLWLYCARSTLHRHFPKSITTTDCSFVSPSYPYLFGNGMVVCMYVLDAGYLIICRFWTRVLVKLDSYKMQPGLEEQTKLFLTSVWSMNIAWFLLYVDFLGRIIGEPYITVCCNLCKSVRWWYGCKN
jgi:hypothetical protein